MAENVTAATDANFDALTKDATTPVVVDFWAPWCGPCKMLGPILEDVAKEMQGRLKVVKVDIDQSPELASRFGIRSIPTLILFKNGEAVAQQMGAMPRSQLVSWIEQNS
ncbi:thioredoxin [Formicincola oecophyllae]|uniref:Thioredoxin n=1 Tax=Formicincola oecophyllae TaxID=2558361 RepID=A0A4Y6U921_9PROT|nr:thioredoxin [Formicincola oecophyllae]QDH13694.1 thioredoxin [Formicincola oecophyllae]